MIKIANVSKDYAGRKALDHVSLELASEKTHVLLGSSGSGKSTLLRLIMGLLAPSEGQIFIDGVVMNSLEQRELVRKMGYVIQDGGLFPHMTVSQNVSLNARVLRWPSAKINKRLVELLDLVGFDPLLLGRFPKELSGGQKQRVALMRSLMLDPPLLLLDEPLGALDPIVRGSLQSQLKSVFNRLKKTVLIVTHDIGEAAFFGHTITLMKDGKIVQHGTFENLVENPSEPFVTEFINAQKPPVELKVLYEKG